MAPTLRLTRGLRLRVVVGMIGAAVVSLALLSVTSLTFSRRALTQDAHATALEETRAALALAEDELVSTDVEAVAAFNTELREIGDFESVAVTDGRQVRTDVRLGLDDVPEALRNPTVVPSVAETDTPAGRFVLTATHVRDGLDFYLFFSLASLQEDLATLTRVVVLTAIATGLVSILGTLFASRRVFRPVDATADAARRLAAGAMGTRVSEQTGGFTDLTDAFNDMATALEQTIERLRTMEAGQRRFVADVSHELRTPMTALTTAADLFEPGLDRLEGPSRRAAEMLVAEVRRLRQLVEDLMEISRLDASAGTPETEPVDLANLLPRFAEHHGWGDDVAIHVEGHPVAFADARRVHAIVRNLVENALTHGAPPVVVTASTHTDRRHGDRVHVDVVDAGPGVPEEHRERIFDRFHKADEARTRGHGSGLGLGIARDNARLLGGDVTLEPSGPDEGAHFRLDLPGVTGT